VSLDSTLNASDLSLDTTTEIIDGADSTSGNENNEQTGKSNSLLLGAMLETRWELEPKCVPQLFLGLLLVTCQSAIGQFFFTVSSNSPRSLCGS